jgi:2-keto-3-deoxy-L-fuconate dehydrogenase
MFYLHHKKAIITGGGSGIGQAVAALFAKRGAEVHIIELTPEHATTTINLIKNDGEKAFAYGCDVSNQQQVQQVFQQIGAIDILINNAGVAHIGKAATTAEEDFERVFKVNVKGVYNCLHEAIPLMQQRGGGTILNLGSIAAHVGISDRFAYSMAKGAVHAMTLSVAKDYIKQNIRCNSISPARVHTPFVDGFISKNYEGREAEMFEKLSQSQPIGRMGKPEEIAALVLYLCSDEAAFITGSDYPIDGGFMTLNS